MPDAYTIIVVDDTNGEERLRESCHSYLINYFRANGTGTAGHVSIADTVRGYATIRARLMGELGTATLKDLDIHLDNMLANEALPDAID